MRTTSDICIIGGGPAGSTLAARMAQLGHDVCLIERSSFPRRHLGESLSPGVRSLLATIGAREAVDAAGFPRVRHVMVNWDEGPRERRDPAAQGLLVDRGHFDRLLLDNARSCGVRVLQPATIREQRRHDEGWSLRIEKGGRAIELRTAFLADASGRSRALPARRRRTGCRTLALYAYWQGSGLPEQPRIEAGTDAWYWGVPLPDGTYNTLVFVDTAHFRTRPAAPLLSRFRTLIDRSGLLAGCRDPRILGRVMAADATPYLDEESVTPHSIKVGDAALALDPLSSSGVQKAIQTALAGAVVVNTLLRKPEMHAAAFRFYRNGLSDASERHREWATAHYGTVADTGAGKFWQDRATGSRSSSPPLAAEGLKKNHPTANTPLVLSSGLEFVDLPCIEGEFVRIKSAVRHPNLEGPVAFLRDWELAPLLRQVPTGMTSSQLARFWLPRIPLDSGRSIIGWLVERGILVAHRRSAA
ncbi:MAG: tryptophan 7-halogenase [Verrucomicrobia bacterium]|nr:tryptophan 7-halogenase [Verrucomicrobiota bacterium]